MKKTAHSSQVSGNLVCFSILLKRSHKTGSKQSFMSRSIEGEVPILLFNLLKKNSFGQYLRIELAWAAANKLAVDCCTARLLCLCKLFQDLVIWVAILFAQGHKKCLARLLNSAFENKKCTHASVFIDGMVLDYNIKIGTCNPIWYWFPGLAHLQDSILPSDYRPWHSLKWLNSLIALLAILRAFRHHF